MVVKINGPYGRTGRENEDKTMVSAVLFRNTQKGKAGK
jgi:hypothetical protein